MALRDIFKFRDPPETETSKPFLEHLEDLRWTIVKIALALGTAMIVCFAFRSTLVHVLQTPLRGLGSEIGTLKALGITDSIVIRFTLRFMPGLSSPSLCCCIFSLNLFCRRLPLWRNVSCFQPSASVSRCFSRAY